MFAVPGSLFFFFLIFIYLATSGLSCITWDIFLQCADSLVVVHKFSCPKAHGILVPQFGIEPTPSALEGRFLTIGPPGKSLEGFRGEGRGHLFWTLQDG